MPGMAWRSDGADPLGGLTSPPYATVVQSPSQFHIRPALARNWLLSVWYTLPRCQPPPQGTSSTHAMKVAVRPLMSTSPRASPTQEIRLESKAVKSVSVQPSAPR